MGRGETKSFPRYENKKKKIKYNKSQLMKSIKSNLWGKLLKDLFIDEITSLKDKVFDS